MNSLEKKVISKALTDFDISHDEFILVINKEHNHFRLEESIRAKDNQLGDFEQDKLIEYSKRIGIDEIYRQNDRQSLKLKTEVQNLSKL